MAEEKKYYWLKLKRDFFKRHDIRIIEEMPNGKDYILFYLKLLLESVDHEGELRFSDTIPYNEQMLSVITNTNIDIVRSAMRVFSDLKMVELFDDQTIYMTEVQKLVGSESTAAERMRKHREKRKALERNNVQNCYTEIEIYKEKEPKKEKKSEEAKRKRFTPPTLEEIETYCRERQNDVDPKKFYDYFTASDWVDSRGQKVKSWKQKIITWEGHSNKKTVGTNGIPISNAPSDLDGLF